jgi:hypothetical protein
VKIGVYWSYLHATGYCLSALILAFLIAMQLSKNLSDAWLSRWTLNSNDSNTWNENGTYTDYRYRENDFLNDEKSSRVGKKLPQFVHIRKVHEKWSIFVFTACSESL